MIASTLAAINLSQVGGFVGGPGDDLDVMSVGLFYEFGSDERELGRDDFGVCGFLRELDEAFGLAFVKSGEADLRSLLAHGFQSSKVEGLENDAAFDGGMPVDGGKDEFDEVFR